MTDRESPKCPMGHDMELIRTAIGGWRYGCLKCATSFKAIKRASYGWLSPIKSTREKAYEAAMARPLLKPLTKAELPEMVRDIVYVETICYGINPWPMFLRSVEKELLILKAFGMNGEIQCDLKEYGMEYRFWALKPRSEERMAAEWME